LFVRKIQKRKRKKDGEGKRKKDGEGSEGGMERELEDKGWSWKAERRERKKGG
jgi:hypothetical protein